MDESIFISYSHQDAAAAHETAEALRQASGMAVWTDHKLRGGENYFSVIANQIMASRFFVFLVSGSSVRSDWCLRELEFAASEHKRIVAVWLEEVPIPPEIRLIIQNTHYIHYSTDGSFFQALRGAFSGDAVPAAETVFLDDDADRTWSDTCFLSSDTIKKIESLLNAYQQEKFSFCFRPENACLLGIAYDLGVRVEPEPSLARFFYRISARGGSRDGKFLYAAFLQREQASGPDAPLTAEMQEAADQGSVYALTCLGSSCYHGLNGCEKNYARAYDLWQQAADAGGVTAMYKIAWGYRTGEFRRKDPELAYLYAAMAAEQGYPRASRLLGFLYEQGEFFRKDLQKALSQYRQAVLRGDLLSLCYEGWVLGELGDGAGRLERYRRAADLAQEGKISSGLPFFRLGSLYEADDMAGAAALYLKGAARHHEPSRSSAAAAILKVADPEQRLSLLREAFRLQCPGAAFALGRLEPADASGRLSDQAIAWYTAGAESGDMNCAAALISRYSWVIGHGQGREDQQEALRWFRFLFANADGAYLEHMRKTGQLATYYYAYAVELDCSSGVQASDREFVKLYFEKSLQESPVHLLRIVCFVVDGYLFPEDSGSGLRLDVVHAEEVLVLAEKHLHGFCRYLLQEAPGDFSVQWSRLGEKLTQGCARIADCYGSGISVPRNKAASKDYRSKAASAAQRLEEIAAGVRG